MKTTPELASIEKTLAGLWLQQRQALDRMAEEERLRAEARLVRDARDKKEGERRRKEDEEALTRLRRDQEQKQAELAYLAADIGAPYQPVFLSKDVSGLSAKKLDRLAYICFIVNEASETWEQLVRLAIGDTQNAAGISEKRQEQMACALELASYLQVSNLRHDDALRLTSQRRIAMKKLREFDGVWNDQKQQFADVACVSERDARLDAALEARDRVEGLSMPVGAGEEEFRSALEEARKGAWGADMEDFNRRWKRDDRPWIAFNCALDARRQERMENGRNSLLPSDALTVIRAELARLRLLNEQARTDEGAAEQLATQVQSAESVIGAAVDDDEVKPDLKPQITESAVRGIEEVRRVEDDANESRERFKNDSFKV